MGYFGRLLTKSRKRISLGELQRIVGDQTSASFHLEEGTPELWDLLTVRSKAGETICRLGRDERGQPDGLLEEELAEFGEELSQSLPKRGARWVIEYLEQVNAIYSVEYTRLALDGLAEPNPAEVLWSLKQLIGGILQSDREGFSNEDGYTVTWQFSEGAEGNWNFALLDTDGSWKRVNIDLGNPQQRLAFQRGDAQAV